MVRARRRWMREQGLFDPARLVFIDETCTNTAMVGLRGRAPRGERLLAHAPHGAWKRVTFVGALRRCGMTAPFVIEGAMNGALFLVYVKQCLVPTLKRGDIVLMDNLPVRQLMNRGARWLLPCVNYPGAPCKIKLRSARTEGSMLTASRYQLPPLCPNCDKSTRLTPSLFAILFRLEIFECECGLVVTETAAAKVSKLPAVAVSA